MSELKPWPSDAVIIVAAPRGQAIVENMRGRPFGCRCRDCGERLLADSFTLDTALYRMPERQGRPIAFLCVDCCVTYDRNSIRKLVDHRRHTTEI